MVTPTLDACPFIDEDDPRCASHFTLSRLSQAFGECLGGYHACSTYWGKLRNPRPRNARNTSDVLPVISITLRGRSLQPTGS